jgi:hypothetical protein
MNCPHCQKELPATYAETWCPLCGRDLEPEGVGAPARQAFEPGYVTWRKFFIVLLAPPVCCFLALAAGLELPAFLFGMFGSFVSGLWCARMIINGSNLTGFKNRLTQFGVAMLLCCLSIFLCFIGCISPSIISQHGM